MNPLGKIVVPACPFCRPRLTRPNRMLRRLARRRGIRVVDAPIVMHADHCPRALLGGLTP